MVKTVKCPKCGLVQDAQNEFCEKCRENANLYELLNCETCEHHKLCILDNLKGRCWKYEQKNLVKVK